MFKPDKLAKFAIAGSQQHIERTIDILYDMGVIELIEYMPGDQSEFSTGKPLQNADWSSAYLVKVRSIKKLLNIEDKDPYKGKKFIEHEVHANIDAKIAAIELESSRAFESKTKIERELSLLRQKLVDLAIFIDLGLPLEYYGPYKTLDVFVGMGNDKTEQKVYGVTQDLLVLKGKNSYAYAIFVKKESSTKIREKLEAEKFVASPVAVGTGDPQVEADKIVEMINKLEAKRKEIDKIITELKHNYEDELLAMEEVLSIISAKSMSPLNMALGKHTFILFGWVPEREYSKLVKNVNNISSSLIIDRIKIEKEESIPTKYKQPWPLNRLTVVTDTYSTPNYHEIDPTLFFNFFFALFFGMIIGDLGYGIVFIAAGATLVIRKVKDMVEFGWLVFWAGVSTSLFGYFVYGDFLGIPFSPSEQFPNLYPYSWSSILHNQLGIASVVEKLSPSGIYLLLAVSILLGILQISMGLIISIINELHEGLKAALGRTGWLLVFFALAVLIIVRISAAPLVRILWNSFMYHVNSGVTIVGFFVPYTSIYLLLAGIAFITVGEGAIALMEILSLLSNLISYLRVGILAVAKGAIIYAFYVLLFSSFVFTHNMVYVIVGLVLTVFLQVFLFFLGSLSAGIQAIRLNYVEFGTKFFKGGGIKFNPFGYIRKYTVKNM